MGRMKAPVTLKDDSNVLNFGIDGVFNKKKILM